MPNRRQRSKQSPCGAGRRHFSLQRPSPASIVGAVIPFSPLAAWFGFKPLPPLYFLVVGVMVAVLPRPGGAGKAFLYGWIRRPRPLSIKLGHQTGSWELLPPTWRTSRSLIDDAGASREVS